VGLGDLDGYSLAGKGTRNEDGPAGGVAAETLSPESVFGHVEIDDLADLQRG
jgi:hypothetical protein